MVSPLPSPSTSPVASFTVSRKRSRGPHAAIAAAAAAAATRRAKKAGAMQASVSHLMPTWPSFPSNRATELVAESDLPGAVDNWHAALSEARASIRDPSISQAPVGTVSKLRCSLVLMLFPDGFVCRYYAADAVEGVDGFLQPYEVDESRYFLDCVKNGRMPEGLAEMIPCTKYNDQVVAEIWDFTREMTKSPPCISALSRPANPICVRRMVLQATTPPERKNGFQQLDIVMDEDEAETFNRDVENQLFEAMYANSKMNDMVTERWDSTALERSSVFRKARRQHAKHLHRPPKQPSYEETATSGRQTPKQLGRLDVTDSIMNSISPPFLSPTEFKNKHAQPSKQLDTKPPLDLSCEVKGDLNPSIESELKFDNESHVEPTEPTKPKRSSTKRPRLKMPLPVRVASPQSQSTPKQAKSKAKQQAHATKLWVKFNEVNRFFQAAAQFEQEHAQSLHVNIGRLMSAKATLMDKSQLVIGSMDFIASQLDAMVWPTQVIEAAQTKEEIRQRGFFQPAVTPAFVRRCSFHTTPTAASSGFPHPTPSIFVPLDDSMMSQCFLTPPSSSGTRSPVMAASIFEGMDEFGSLEDSVPFL